MMILMPGLQSLTEPQHRLFLLSLALVHRFRGEGLEAARDSDVANAAGTLASNYETESKGLIYEQRAASLPAQRIVDELRTVFTQVGRERPSAIVRDAAVVLRRLEQLARDVGKPAPSDPVAFLDLAGRVAGRLGSAGPEAGERAANDEPSEPTIIMP